VFQIKVAEKIEKHILSAVNILWKLCHLGDNTGKYGRARPAIDDNMMRRMRFSGYLSAPPPQYTHTQNVLYLFLFHLNSGYVKSVYFYVCTYIACLFRRCYFLLYDATVVDNVMLLFGVSCQLFVLTIHIMTYNKIFTFQYSISLSVIAFLFVRAVLTFL